MFSIGGAELLVIALLVLLLFGPDAFPEIARMLARAYKWLAGATGELNELLEESGAAELAGIAGVERRGVLGMDEDEDETGGPGRQEESEEEDPDDYLGEGRSEPGETAQDRRGELPEYLKVDDYLGERDGE